MFHSGLIPQQWKQECHQIWENSLLWFEFNRRLKKKGGGAERKFSKILKGLKDHLTDGRYQFYSCAP